MNENKKVVLITGGSGTLGLSLVTHYLSKQYIVATFSRHFSEIAKSKFENIGNLYWADLDITNTDKVSEFISMIKDKFQKIDIFINNACFLHEGLFCLTKDEIIEKSIDTNIKAATVIFKTVSKIMMNNKCGVITNISSINSVKGHKGVSIYSMTKSAIDGLMKSLAKELAPLNIRVNSIVPGYFMSGLVSYLSEERLKQILKRTPLGRLGDVTDVTNAVIFISSRKASFITGQNIIVDGGMTC